MDFETIFPLLIFGFFLLMAIIRSLAKSKEKKPNPLLNSDLTDINKGKTNHQHSEISGDELQRRIRNLSQDYEEIIHEEGKKKEKSYQRKRIEDSEITDYNDDLEQNSLIDELVDDFDLRKAVIYTEIMNRKYN